MRTIPISQNRTHKGVCMCACMWSSWWYQEVLVRRWFTHHCAWNHNEQILLPQYKATEHPSSSPQLEGQVREWQQPAAARTIPTEERAWKSCQTRVTALCPRWLVQGASWGKYSGGEGSSFGILTCYCIFVLFLFSKNGYPGREWASKDTHPQVIHLLLEPNLPICSWESEGFATFLHRPLRIIWRKKNNFCKMFYFIGDRDDVFLVH